MQTKITPYIGLILLIVVIGIFVHSEVFNHGHVDLDQHDHDYCNIIATSVIPQQSNIQYHVDCDVVIEPRMDVFVLSEEADSVSNNDSFTPLLNNSRTILNQSFLI